MNTIVKYKHHRAEVSVREDLKGKHREYGLCYKRCKFYTPDEVENCVIADAIFIANQLYNIVTPVWECPKYASSDN